MMKGDPPRAYRELSSILEFSSKRRCLSEPIRLNASEKASLSDLKRAGIIEKYTLSNSTHSSVVF